ncbi:MAG: hypothetical protein ABI972_11615 [Acidobacteriota bacterium]
MLHEGKQQLVLDREAFGYICKESFDILVDPREIIVQLVVSHPNPDEHSTVIRETYRRTQTGSSFYLAHRTPTALLEDLDEETCNPVRFLLRWIEERVAPQGGIDWRIKELNAKLARFQLPTAIGSTRIELVPSTDETRVTIIVPTAGKRTHRTLTHRNGQWEMSGE